MEVYCSFSSIWWWEGEKTDAQTILTDLLDDRSYIESQIAEQNKFGRGLSPAIGSLLRERLEDLPRTFGRSGSALQDEIGEVLLTLNNREEQRQELVDNPDHVERPSVSYSMIRMTPAAKLRTVAAP